MLKRILTFIVFFGVVGVQWSFSDDTTRLVPDAPVKRFKLPKFGSKGFKTWDLQGEKGVYLDESHILIKEMNLNTFSGNEDMILETTIQSAKANVYPSKNQAEGNEGVTLKGATYTAKGQKWLWQGEQKSMQIDSDVTVTFDQGIGQFLGDSTPSTDGVTQIFSDHLKIQSTDVETQFSFSGNVRILNDRLDATCCQLEVTSEHAPTEDLSLAQIGDLRDLVALGEVVILQDGKKACAGKAVIFPREEKLVLTENPTFEDREGTVFGEKITLKKGENRAIVEGGPNGGRPLIELPESIDLSFDKKTEKLNS